MGVALSFSRAPKYQSNLSSSWNELPRELGNKWPENTRVAHSDDAALRGELLDETLRVQEGADGVDVAVVDEHA